MEFSFDSCRYKLLKRNALKILGQLQKNLTSKDAINKTKPRDA